MVSVMRDTSTLAVLMAVLSAAMAASTCSCVASVLSFTALAALMASKSVVAAAGLLSQDELKFSIEGDASIVAVSNGDINSDELNVTSHRRLWQGSALVILRAGKSPSKISLRTTSQNYKPVVTKLETR
jgi:hypothetical protein